MSTNPDKTRRLECCCCGEDAGRWVQWHNRDTGYGMCRRCIDRFGPRMGADEIRSNYGVEGVNYAPAASIAMEG